MAGAARPYSQAETEATARLTDILADLDQALNAVETTLTDVRRRIVEVEGRSASAVEQHRDEVAAWLAKLHADFAADLAEMRKAIEGQLLALDRDVARRISAVPLVAELHKEPLGPVAELEREQLTARVEALERDVRRLDLETERSRLFVDRVRDLLPLRIRRRLTGRRDG